MPYSNHTPNLLKKNDTHKAVNDLLTRIKLGPNYTRVRKPIDGSIGDIVLTTEEEFNNNSSGTKVAYYGDSNETILSLANSTRHRPMEYRPRLSTAHSSLYANRATPITNSGNINNLTNPAQDLIYVQSSSSLDLSIELITSLSDTPQLVTKYPILITKTISFITEVVPFLS